MLPLPVSATNTRPARSAVSARQRALLLPGSVSGVSRLRSLPARSYTETRPLPVCSSTNNRSSASTATWAGLTSAIAGSLPAPIACRNTPVSEKTATRLLLWSAT